MTQDLASPRLNQHIENFAQVTDWLFRGGDTNENSVISLRDAAVKTVITLRNRESVRRHERELLQAVDIKLIEMPMSYWSLDDEKLDACLAAIDQSARNVFVHCDHGRDRTGIVIAAYRILYQGWSWERAEKELLNFGFRRVLQWYMLLQLKRYLRDKRAQKR